MFYCFNDGASGAWRGVGPGPGCGAQQAAELGEAASDFYTCTLSSRTIVYKGMLNSSAVGPFYKDLKVRPCGSEWCMEKKRA